jgi:mannose-6-phosphate isomerase-like protein (cupin superfamily)
VSEPAPFGGSIADLPRERLAELGLSRSAVRTDDALVVFNWLTPPAGVPLHDHPFDQLSLILEGACVMRVGDDEHRLSAGGFLYIPAGARHGLETVGTVPVFNIDVFAPAREDYLHLAEGQPRA